ncbi:MAG TPA: hypothetical protein VMW40_01090 [Candidatus Bathyarchaeia archaeon]|nr:hypothetical protein [Candidatus Bathyarchaeia archaeon]
MPVPLPQPDMWLVNLKAVTTLGNVILLLCLLVIYAKNYEQIKSKFALGLIAFIILLLVQTFTSNPFVHVMWGFRHINALGLFTIVPDLFEFVALSILLYISLKS